MKIQNNLWIQLLTILLLSASAHAAVLDGIQIHSTISGKGRKTVILVHGWTCDEMAWKSQVPDLSKDYRVITLDLPGHGKSGSPKDGALSMDLFARAIEAVRVEAKVDRVILVGHSMGTPVIIQYARLYPQHAAALVFVDGVIITPGQSSPPFVPEQFSGPEGLKAREAMIRGMFSALTTEEMRQHILSMMLGAPEGTAVGAMKATFDRSIWKEDVIMQPVLGIYAGQSTLPDNPQFMKKRFPNLEYLKMTGTGHFLMLEKPAEFNRVLKAFLEKQNY